jgi:hypothetical protein
VAGAVATQPTWRLDFKWPARIKAAVITVAFFLVFWQLLDFIPPDLGELVYAWTHRLDWSHGPLIPLFSAYLIYAKWDDLRRCPIRYAWLGLPLLVGGLVGYLSALWFVPFGYAKPLSMMITLLG